MPTTPGTVLYRPMDETKVTCMHRGTRLAGRILGDGAWGGGGRVEALLVTFKEPRIVTLKTFCK